LRLASCRGAAHAWDVWGGSTRIDGHEPLQGASQSTLKAELRAKRVGERGGDVAVGRRERQQAARSPVPRESRAPPGAGLAGRPRFARARALLRRAPHRAAPPAGPPQQALGPIQPVVPAAREHMPALLAPQQLDADKLVLV